MKRSMLWKDVWRDVEYVGDDKCLKYLGGDVYVGLLEEEFESGTGFCED